MNEFYAVVLLNYTVFQYYGGIEKALTRKSLVIRSGMSHDDAIRLRHSVADDYHPVLRWRVFGYSKFLNNWSLPVFIPITSRFA